ncbi:MAG: YigZ family protein [Sphaerochaetaceae bacterium]|jgi:uncharacterized YigZ family protein|nr:YigZ family protein [Sphaerochaetaceae bacterium]
MKVPLKPASAEIEVKKSRFIAFAHPITDTREIRRLVSETRKEHPQANHVVHAAVIGPDGNQFSMSDDREPKNTAGRPALEVLKGSSITNIAVLIVRYFGGTLLGTGGLVKAYQDAVRSVLDVLKTEELVEKSNFTLTLSYDVYDQFVILGKALDIVSSEEFGTDIIVRGCIESSKTQEFATSVTELTRGKSLVVFD